MTAFDQPVPTMDFYCPTLNLYNHLDGVNFEACHI